MDSKPKVQIELTSEQQAQIEQAVGKKVTVVELRPEALEARIAPGLGRQ